MAVGFLAPKVILSQLGQRVQKLRPARSLSRPALSELCGVPVSTIKRFEATGGIGTKATFVTRRRPLAGLCEVHREELAVEQQVSAACAAGSHSSSCCCDEPLPYGSFNGPRSEGVVHAELNARRASARHTWRR